MKQLTINNKTFEADEDFIVLLKELNRVGLRTTQHCAGHRKGQDKYITIALDKETDCTVRNIDGIPRLNIRWNRERPLYSGSD